MSVLCMLAWDGSCCFAAAWRGTGRRVRAAFQALPCHACHPPMQAAATDLRHAANTEAAAAEGRLDAALRRLAQALDPGFPPSSRRLEAFELLTAVLQVRALPCSGSWVPQGGLQGKACRNAGTCRSSTLLLPPSA